VGGLGLIGLLSAVAGALRARGDHALAPFALAICAAGLCASAALSVLLPPIAFKPPVLAALLVVGGLLGAVAGCRVALRPGARGAIARGGGWHPLPAGLAIGGLQAAGIARSPDGVVLASAALLAGAAFVGAATVILLGRGLWTSRRRPRGVASGDRGGIASGSRTAPGRSAAGTGAAPGVPYSGARVRVARVHATCGACGGAVTPGWRHCVGCGATLDWE
jgi:hypothetical protein